ncbi:MAG: hypothetical protein HC880_16875 [Bacteroidia bacterium]|nr:hypothetical protein [Bacteroidia bacterium]
MIYAGIANDQTTLYVGLDENAAQVAYDSYQKALELAEAEGGKGTDEIKDALLNLHPVVINFGVAKYNDKNYGGALDAFLLAQKTNPEDTIPLYMLLTWPMPRSDMMILKAP